MSLFTSARVYDRYSNARTRGFNGFAGSTETVGVTDYSGVLLDTETQVPLLGTGTSFTTIPFPERISASARYGDRVTYSVTIVGYKDSTFAISTETDLGAVLIHCGNEFNWNVSLSYDGPACGSLRASGISGSVTIYDASAAPTLTFPYFPGTAPSATVTEDGTDYSDTEGARYYRTWEVTGMTGVPWSAWQNIPTT